MDSNKRQILMLCRYLPNGKEILDRMAARNDGRVFEVSAAVA